MKSRKIILLIVSGTLLVIFIIFLVYKTIFGFNITPKGSRAVLLLSENSTYSRVMDSIKVNLHVRNLKVLQWVALNKHYPVLVKPGRFVIDKKMSYVRLINLLRSGRQTPVKITFNNIRTIQELAGKVGGKIEADSTEIVTFLQNPGNYQNDGFTRESIISVFIPDTYEFYWNTSAKGFYSRMLTEFRKFWNEERLVKAKEKNLTPVEVSILASIIDDEVTIPDEKPRIAGVFLNRLKRGMPLQSCPTIRFALNDYTITRVLKKYLEVDSPYNTYKQSGLPPGPIRCASVEGIDAVLNAEKNDFLYFVAKPDFSGYNNFSRTLAEHNKYAALYQKELDRRKIFR